MTPSKSLTAFPSFIPPKAGTSQIPGKKLAQLQFINSAGAGKAVYKHELYLPYLAPAPIFLPCFESFTAGLGWWCGEGKDGVIGSWIFQGQDWSDKVQRHKKNQGH